MKRISLILLALVLLIMLPACTSASYSDDVALDALTQAIEAALPSDALYSTAHEGSLDDYFTMPDYVTDSVIRFSTNAKNLDQYGIFHVTDGNASAMQALLRDYLERVYEENQVWYDSYIPEETPKLRDADVRVFGNYVVFAVYSGSDKAILFDTVKNNLAA